MRKLTASVGAFLAHLLLITPVFAAEPWEIEVTRPTGAIPEFGPIISGGIRIAIAVGALVCLLYLIWGGLEWMMSGGEKTSVQAAKARITAAFIGLMIILAAWAVIKIIEHLFGFTITTFEFEPFF